MNTENEYLNGLIFKAPNEKAPDYVKAKVSIKRLDLIAALQARDEEWINLDLKESQAGRWHAPIDTWKPSTNGTPRNNAPQPQRRTPEPSPMGEEFTDDIPFASNRSVW